MDVIYADSADVVK